MSAERRAEVLRAAAQAKHAVATKRAEVALRKLIKTGTQINFRAVSSAAGVSVDFLYRHPELRARIEHLRSRQREASPLAAAKPEPDRDDRGVVVALTARLSEARGEVAELKAQLATAKGELLALRRGCSGVNAVRNHALFCDPTVDRLAAQASQLQLTNPVAADRLWRAATAKSPAWRVGPETSATETDLGLGAPR